MMVLPMRSKRTQVTPNGGSALRKSPLLGYVSVVGEAAVKCRAIGIVTENPLPRARFFPFQSNPVADIPPGPWEPGRLRVIGRLRGVNRAIPPRTAKESQKRC
jgi:hypothetical protein